jgi:hypothetical protein
VGRQAALAAAYAVGFAAITAALAAGTPLIDLDLAVRAWSEAHRPPGAEAAGRALNRFGQGGALAAICLALAGWLALRIRRWWPPLYVIVAAALVGMIVLPVKYLTERAAPSSVLPPEQGVPLFATLPPGEYDTSYPAGHVVNSVVWYGVALLLVTALVRAREPARPWRPPPWLWAVVRVGPVVLLLTTTTYLSFHWLTDGLAGLCLGLLVDRGLWWTRRLLA